MLGDIIGVFFVGVMLGRFWFHIVGIYEMTRRPTIHEEAEYIIKNPREFLKGKTQ